jgi:hypothetical protein
VSAVVTKAVKTGRFCVKALVQFLAALPELTILGMSLWQLVGIAREMKQMAKPDELPPARDTNKMLSASNDTPASIIEHTTLTLEPARKERNPRT